MPTELKIPSLGESITEVQIGDWLKAEGDSIASGENVVALESEKATVELPAPVGGKLTKILKQKGAFANIGEVIGHIDDGAAAKPASEAKGAMPPPPKPGAPVAPKPAARTPQALPAETPAPESAGAKNTPRAETAAPPPVPAPPTAGGGSREEEVVPMTVLRRAAARRLVEAQHNAALLATFNEADMTEVIALRKKFGEAFQEKYGIKLGFMSFFVKATVDALKHIPQLNAEIRGNDIVFHNYFDICIAISSGRGLVAPVLRNAERLSFAEIEKAIAALAESAQASRLKPEELTGGTFTITNGGIFGSLLSTPIVNPPQSGVLGMHAIQERPVAINGNVVIRPMMYLALTYDHRIVDGRDAVTFLKRIKEAIETPTRMLLEV